MYKKLARIGPFSCGIFFGVMYLFFFLLMLLTTYLLGRQGIDLTQMMPSGLPAGTEAVEGIPTSVDLSKEGLPDIAMGAGMVLLAGFVAGFLGAIVYNIIAIFTGGIKVRTIELYDEI